MAFAGGDGGWQIVRRGRRGRSRERTYDNRPQRDQGQAWPSWDRGGRGTGGGARVFPGPQQGGRANTRPNLPAPPFGYPSFSRPPPLPSRSWGPQPRSYADVTRQANPGVFYNKGFRQGFWDRQRGRDFQSGRDARYIPASPAFGRLARRIKTVIKIVHHLQNVTDDAGKPQPRMIARMVEILATMIKPAAPKAKTTDLILGNAKNWGHTSLVILQDHYEEALEDALKDLTPDPNLRWQEAFEVATRWTRKNLPRLPQEVVDHAEALVALAMEPMAQDTQTNTGAQTDQHEQLTSRTRRRRTQGEVEFLEEVVIPPERGEQTDGPPRTRDGSSQVEPQDGSPAPLTTAEAPLNRGQEIGGRTEQQVQTGNTTRGTGEPNRQEAPEIEELHDGGSTAAPVLSEPPKEQRVNRRTQTSPGRRTEEVQPSGGAAPVGPSSRTVTVQAQVLRDPSEDDLVEDGSLEGAGEELGRDAPLPLFTSTRHIRTDRKLLDWTLSVSKKWVIIGDSNLSRLPSHDIPHLQIDSYPGANFRHMAEVLSKAMVQLLVEKVVISCGINSRGQKVKETTIKQLQTALRTAKKRFPYAEIWIPLLNYSSDLPDQEKRNLKQLNDHIFKNMPYIPLLDSDSFECESDKVHWTRATGRAMFQHWSTILNLQAP